MQTMTFMNNNKTLGHARRRVCALSYDREKKDTILYNYEINIST